MGILKIVLLVVGVLAMLLGVWWICQGTGLVPIGFMANQMMWAWRGMALAVIGLAVAYGSRRM